MGVIAKSRSQPEHAGLLRFGFIGKDGKVVLGGRLYLRKDAALVYDALRAKYPEHDELQLEVWVVAQHEISPYEYRGVAAKKVLDGPVEHVAGQPFVRHIKWHGPRPKIEGAGEIVEMVGGPDNEQSAELLSRALAIVNRSPSRPTLDDKAWLHH